MGLRYGRCGQRAPSSKNSEVLEHALTSMVVGAGASENAVCDRCTNSRNVGKSTAGNSSLLFATSSAIKGHYAKTKEE